MSPPLPTGQHPVSGALTLSESEKPTVFGMPPFTQNRSFSQVSGSTSTGGGGREGAPPAGAGRNPG